MSRKEARDCCCSGVETAMSRCCLHIPEDHTGPERDDGAWTIPKGEIEAGEERLAAARREFEEETGYRPRGEAQSLGSIRQPGGKVVHVWAIEEDWQPSDLVSNTFEIEWPRTFRPPFDVSRAGSSPVVRPAGRAREDLEGPS